MPDEKPEDNELSEEEKKKTAEIEELIQKKLDECKFEEKGNSYSFEFEGQYFEFKGSPTVFERTQIKAMLASITRFPGASITSSSEYDIASSGDFDLMYSSKAITHTGILLIKPERFDISSFENKMYSFGELITIAERRYSDNKKKQSTKEQ